MAGAGINKGIANPNAAIAKVVPILEKVRVLDGLFIVCPLMLIPDTNRIKYSRFIFGGKHRVGDGCARMPDSAKSRGSLS